MLIRISHPAPRTELARRSPAMIRRLRRLRQQAMTLTEIMIVIIIMAMIAAGVGAAVIPQFTKAKIRTASTDAQAVRAAAESYALDHGTGDCPTVEELVEAGELRRGSRTTDPWGTAFKIECSGSDIEVKSAGPDQQFGGEDDI